MVEKYMLIVGRRGCGAGPVSSYSAFKSCIHTNTIEPPTHTPVLEDEMISRWAFLLMVMERTEAPPRDLHTFPYVAIFLVLPVLPVSFSVPLLNLPPTPSLSLLSLSLPFAVSHSFIMNTFLSPLLYLNLALFRLLFIPALSLMQKGSVSIMEKRSLETVGCAEAALR